MGSSDRVIAKWDLAITVFQYATAEQNRSIARPMNAFARCYRVIAHRTSAGTSSGIAKAKSRCTIAYSTSSIALYRTALDPHHSTFDGPHPATMLRHPAFKRPNRTTMRQVKTDLRGMNATDVHVRAKGILEAMKGNPHFPNPIPTMAEFEAACDALLESNTETELGGNRYVYAVKQQRFDTVRSMIKSLAAYVGTVAKGDSQIILSAAFEQRRPALSITSMDAPQKVRARTGILPHTIDLRWQPVHGAKVYRIYINTGSLLDESAWRVLTVTSNSRYTATGLESLTYNAFRIEAIGASVTSPMSQAATALSIGTGA